MIYKCKKCPYSTNIKADFTAHDNKVFPCRPGVLHGNVKKKQKFICEICHTSYSTSGNLKKHYNAQSHQKNIIKGNNNVANNGNNDIANNGNNNNANNNNNNNNNVNVNGNITNIVNNNFFIRNYNCYDAKDLKLFDQYRFLISIPTPHIVLLDMFNLNPNEPRYHNIHYGNEKSSNVNFVKDDKWDKDEAKPIFNSMIISGTNLFRSVYNRFRIFFSNKARTDIPGFYFKEFNINNDKIAACIRKHLYKNRSKTQKNIVRTEKHIDNEDIPNDRNDKIFWALHMNFIWDEVKQFFVISDEIKINFDADLNSIKNELIEKNLSFKFCENLYNKIIKRIDRIISTAKNFTNEAIVEKYKNETIFKNSLDHNDLDMDDSDMDDSIVYRIHTSKSKFNNGSRSESESEHDEKKSKIDSNFNYSEHDIDEFFKHREKKFKHKLSGSKHKSSGSKSESKHKSSGSKYKNA